MDHKLTLLYLPPDSSRESVIQLIPDRSREQLKLLSLPPEILDHILDYFSQKELAKILTVCRLFSELIPKHWKIRTVRHKQYFQHICSGDSYIRYLKPNQCEYNYFLKEWLRNRSTRIKLGDWMPDYVETFENMTDYPMFFCLNDNEYEIPKEETKFEIFQGCLTFTTRRVICKNPPLSKIPINQAKEIVRQSLIDSLTHEVTIHKSQPLRNNGNKIDLGEMMSQFVLDNPCYCIDAPTDMFRKQHKVNRDWVFCFSQPLLLEGSDEELKDEVCDWIRMQASDGVVGRMRDYSYSRSNKLLTINYDYLGTNCWMMCEYDTWFTLSEEQIKFRKQVNSNTIPYQEFLNRWQHYYDTVINPMVDELINEKLQEYYNMLEEDDFVLLPLWQNIKNLTVKSRGYSVMGSEDKLKESYDKHMKELEANGWRDLKYSLGLLGKP